MAPQSQLQSQTAVLFAASLAAFLAWKHIQKPEKGSSTLAPSDPAEADKHCLRLAQEYRLGLDHPQQSHFRVVAVLRLEDSSLVYGTNDEPSPNISLALCAERCAFLRYRAQRCTSPVEAVYIVTDADTTVAPGTQCREYMHGHPATTPKTRIVLQSRDSRTEPTCWTLAELIPYPSVYAGMPPEEQLAWGQAHRSSIQEQLQALQVPGLSRLLLKSLLKAAAGATELDARDPVHAVRYGAAVALQTVGEGTEILAAAQVKALEYGSTLDAVGQLASRILARVRAHDTKVLAVVQVDQFGIPHGLFAQARAFLVEHGFGDCAVVLSSVEEESVRVRCVSARELSPLVPEFRS